MAQISSNTAASTQLHQRGGIWAQQLWEFRPQQCSLHDMFTKKLNKSRIRSKVTNNQEKSTNLSLEWITCLPSKKKRSELPPKNILF